MASEKRLIDARFAQHIANVELDTDNAGVVQWVLSHTPTVDAVEVVHGRWKSAEEYEKELGAEQSEHSMVCFCSECHNPSVIYYGWRYCPNCGAKMDGGKNG